MLEFENQNIKFKQEYVPDIRKEVMVFANAEGDTVYVGVRQDGAVLVLVIGGAVIMTGAASLGTSFAILPELKKSKKQKKREFNASGSFKVLPEDDHRKIYRQKH